jgi:hypothetical protein
MRENVLLSTSTSNSSFLNGNIDGNYADSNDRLQILSCDTRENYREPLTKLRKIAFFASIFSIIAVVIVFLLLPCNKNCVAKNQSTTNLRKTINWIKKYDKIEMKGKINTISSAQTSSSSSSKGPLNLIFMYRNDKIFPGKSKQKSSGGIISLSGNSGDVLWKTEMSYEAKNLDCSLIDCDNNGVNDCIVLDDFNQLACLDYNGHWLYYNSNPKPIKQPRQDLLDFPLILPDLNNDKVYEIVMGVFNGKSNTTNLLLISGANGQKLAEIKQNCTYIHKLQLDFDYVIKYICIVKENSEQQVFKNLTEFINLMIKKPQKSIKNLTPVSLIPQHKYFGRRASIDSQTIIANVNDKELVIENKGKFPREIKTSIKLTSMENGIKKVYYNFTGSKIYSFTPVPFSLNTTSSRSHVDNVHGFILKMWNWNGTEISYNLLDKSRIKRNKRDLKSQRSNFTNQTYMTTSVYKTNIRFLKESILLIVFNSTHMKAENASQSNIVQFCQNTIYDTICQPNLTHQESSIIITDIDGDGSQELVSYYSTFYDENHGENGDRWKLRTYVQLFKLETELPKLYAFDIF